MRLQNWFVFSDCIPKTEIIFPVRPSKNGNAKCEQLWRDEQLQLFWSCFACIGGILKSACGYELITLIKYLILVNTLKITLIIL